MQKSWWLTNYTSCIITVLAQLIQLVQLVLTMEGKLLIALNYRDSKPIYEQIKDGFRRLIITGALETDEKLPSVRELAVSLSINPNTIQRAYRELEAEGFIYSVAGKGSFAAAVSEASKEREEELLKKFDQISREYMELTHNSEILKKRIEELDKEVNS